METIRNNEGRRKIKEYTVSWDDTGRSKLSSGGRNISDFTLSANEKRCKILRADRFDDFTADVPIDQFFSVTGNEVCRFRPTIPFQRVWESFGVLDRSWPLMKASARLPCGRSKNT